MTFTDYRWRLQLLAEERIGKLVREDASEEDAAFRRASKMADA